MNAILKQFQYGDHNIHLETGRIARQASGSVLASMGDTTVLVTVVAAKEPSDRDFLPLTVDYEEKTYSAGRIPGGFLNARDAHRKKLYSLRVS